MKIRRITSTSVDRRKVAREFIPGEARRCSSIFFILLLILYSIAQAQPPQPLASPSPDSTAFRGNLFKLQQENPLPYEQDISNLPVVQMDGSTATLVQVRSKFSGTYHAAQDEMLYLISGRGLMVVAGETKPIQPGDLVIIRCGQTYTIENRSAETLVALAVISQTGSR